MAIVNHRQYRIKNKKRKLPKWLKIAAICAGALIVLFVLANLVMALLYRNKVLPHYSVAAVPIGNIRYDELSGKVPIDRLLPGTVVFKKDDKSKKVTPKDLGVTVDWAATQNDIKQSRSWLPILSLFMTRSVPAQLQLDNARFSSAVKELETTFTKAPLPERIAFQGDNFAIAPPQAGYTLDAVQLRLDLVRLLEQGKSELSAPTVTTNSTEPTGKLDSELKLLQKRLDTSITLINGSQSKQLGRAEIASFYEPAGQTLTLSSAKIRQVIDSAAAGFGIAAINPNEAVSASQYALFKQAPVKFVLAAQGAKAYHYCTALKGVNTSALSEFQQKLAAVYGDPRGWNQGGVTLIHAESGCDFTVWLSVPASMTGFGSICDNYYSCRVGPNVVINYDRWMGATDPWNAASGSLEDYRVMVINHETGHWFGFAHRSCTGAGQPAPVMQQQSIDLQGCKFNPWPTPAELAAL